MQTDQQAHELELRGGTKPVSSNPQANAGADRSVTSAGSPMAEQRSSAGGIPDELTVTWVLPGDAVRPLAEELNAIIHRENPHLFAMLSEFGKRLYFPKGILAQSAEAKEKAQKFDATIGIAYERGRPMYLPAVMKYFNGLTPAEALSYAPATGRPDLRKRWHDDLLTKNPSLKGKAISSPIVTSGVTHALAVAADLFVDPGDVVLLPDKFWENYELLFAVRHRAQIGVFPFFDGSGGFNIAALRGVLAKRPVGSKTIVILNFPNNPTGYSISRNEASALVETLIGCATAGRNLVVVCDDAYFGLFYDQSVLDESLFALLAGCHERIAAVKVDGPTKEQFVWGFRTGMITFGLRAESNIVALYNAMEKKCAGAIRSAISNCSQVAQSVLAKAMSENECADQRRQKKEILEARARKVREILDNPAYAELWAPYPFNAGYFMCLRLKRLNAEQFRKHLLERYGVGVIADGEHDIRVAFSAVELEQLPELFDLLAQAARDLNPAS